MRADETKRRARNVVQCCEMFRATSGVCGTGVTVGKPRQKAAPVAVVSSAGSPFPVSFSPWLISTRLPSAASSRSPPFPALRGRWALSWRSRLRLGALDDDSAHMRRRLVAARTDPFLRQPILHRPPALRCRGALWLCLPLGLGVPAGGHFLRVVYPRRPVCAVVVSPWCVGDPLRPLVASRRPRGVPFSAA